MSATVQADAECKWCSKTFKSERTLAAHMCVRKRRWADKDMTHCRLGLRVFQIFYEIGTNAKKTKTMEDFVASQYYTEFVKFGRSCVRNEYLDPEAFAEWLVKEGKKLKVWSDDVTYDEFLLYHVKRETGLRALERSIIYLSSWGKETGNPWQDYFRMISTNRAIHDIRAAKISPWLIYLSETGAEMLTRLNSEQIKMIEHVIDAQFWAGVFQKHLEEVDAVEETCKAAGI